ncbi:MAG: 2'-deoxycytidine 5'-triphosphate deaminase [Halofilum sp. (in: g-proteobacteria)]|nr:2'-deoxycytidine 5'-triphosphate deaminase [Halofilum sp. (in: g-proteobacteria)]
MIPDTVPRSAGSLRKTGVLSSRLIEQAIEQGHIEAGKAIAPEQIQPSSLDLRLGPTAYRVTAGFLPGRKRTVSACLQQQGEDVVEIDLSSPQVLERGHVYIVPLLETLNLSKRTSAKANPKSTTGRLDIFTRLITDHGTQFDRVPDGYKGKLYAEISPRSFSIQVSEGATLNQLRFVVGTPTPSDSSIRKLHADNVLVYAQDGTPIDARIERGLTLSIDLDFHGMSEIVGYVARNTNSIIDINRIAHYEVDKFWKPIYRPDDGQILIEPDHFYILASKEMVRIPPDYAAEMLPFDASIGEFRAHYAGFFDPGFGFGNGEIPGVRAVLEVKAHYVPFYLQHGQMRGKTPLRTNDGTPPACVWRGPGLLVLQSRPHVEQAVCPIGFNGRPECRKLTSRSPTPAGSRGSATTSFRCGPPAPTR